MAHILSQKCHIIGCIVLWKYDYTQTHTHTHTLHEKVTKCKSAYRGTHTQLCNTMRELKSHW